MPKDDSTALVPKGEHAPAWSGDDHRIRVAAAKEAGLDVAAVESLYAEMAELCCAQPAPVSPDGAPPADDKDRPLALALRDLARRTSAGPLATRPTAAELLQLLAALAPDAS